LPGAPRAFSLSGQARQILLGDDAVALTADAAGHLSPVPEVDYWFLLQLIPVSVVD